jgi:glycosyltransferase involved in cell wall biosynthesis
MARGASNAAPSRTSIPARRSPLRVLYLSAYPHRLAGANRSLLELVSHLPRGEVRPLVALTAEGPVAQAYRAVGLEPILLPVPAALNTFGGGLLRASLASKLGLALRYLTGLTASLATLLRSRAIDVVHVNEPRALGLATAAARLAGCKVVAHLRGELPFSRPACALFELAPDRIVAVSDAVRNGLSEYGRAKTTRVYNGIGASVPDQSLALPWLEALGRRGVVRVGCFAQIVPFKGIHHLFEAVALLNSRGLGGRLAVFCLGDLPGGYEDYHRWLWERHEAMGLTNVTVAGWQASPYPWYRHMDVAVLPSVTHELLPLGDTIKEIRGNEGFPRTHLEAMHFGLPIVGTRIAGVPEQVLDGETGFVVPPADPEALAEALGHLVQSSELRHRFGSAGRQRVTRLFSTEAYVRGVLEVYRGLWAS